LEETAKLSPATDIAACPPPPLGLASVLDLSHSDRCAVESHHSNLTFPGDMLWSLFPHGYLSSVYLWWGTCFDLWLIFQLHYLVCYWILRVLCIFWI
jgi:hypothetical protein